MNLRTLEEIHPARSTDINLSLYVCKIWVSADPSVHPTVLPSVSARPYDRLVRTKDERYCLTVGS